MFRYVGLKHHHKPISKLCKNLHVVSLKFINKSTKVKNVRKQYHNSYHKGNVTNNLKEKKTNNWTKPVSKIFWEDLVNSGQLKYIVHGRKKCFPSYQNSNLCVKSQLRLLDSLHNQIQTRTYSKEKDEDDPQPEKQGISAWLRKNLRLEIRPKANNPNKVQKVKPGKSYILENASSMEEAEKLKLAFTDGYMAASRQMGESSSRWSRIFTPLLTMFFVSGLVICLLLIASGTLFRSQLGKFNEINPEDIHVTFGDVKGAEEAKQELKEIVEFLKNPAKFSVLGGKLPKGVLLVGPPGTGKTLLARAVAGEARVPFFHAAGPEFDEVLVGQGARRVRDLFKAAKEAAPCVIFIDEIDSVGSKRTNSMLHPYANQTINQLLSEMDGFHQNQGVVVLGATNRREDLDKALLRPGRFDVEVTVPIPDFNERKQILQYYIDKVLNEGVDVEILARGTVGFTGADLENMVNQAALKAAIDGADNVTMSYLENAKDKILMGPERKSRIPDYETNLITAYHEGGHTIVCFYTKDSKPLHKVTILPRGHSLGHTAFIPEKEQYLVKKSQLLATMDTLMGGRAAEEIIFGPDKITTGASKDLKEATSIATHMVKEWGMSEKVGLRTLDSHQNSSEAVDAEISWLLQESYKRAKTIVKNYSRELKLLVEALIKYETLDADDVKAILMERRKN